MSLDNEAVREAMAELHSAMGKMSAKEKKAMAELHSAIGMGINRVKDDDTDDDQDSPPSPQSDSQRGSGTAYKFPDDDEGNGFDLKQARRKQKRVNKERSPIEDIREKLFFYSIEGVNRLREKVEELKKDNLEWVDADDKLDLMPTAVDVGDFFVELYEVDGKPYINYYIGNVGAKNLTPEIESPPTKQDIGSMRDGYFEQMLTQLIGSRGRLIGAQKGKFLIMRDPESLEEKEENIFGEFNDYRVFTPNGFEVTPDYIERKFSKGLRKARVQAAQQPLTGSGITGSKPRPDGSSAEKVLTNPDLMRYINQFKSSVFVRDMKAFTSHLKENLKWFTPSSRFLDDIRQLHEGRLSADRIEILNQAGVDVEEVRSGKTEDVNHWIESMRDEIDRQRERMTVAEPDDGAVDDLIAGRGISNSKSLASRRFHQILSQ